MQIDRIAEKTTPYFDDISNSRVRAPDFLGVLPQAVACSPHFVCMQRPTRWKTETVAYRHVKYVGGRRSRHASSFHVKLDCSSNTCVNSAIKMSRNAQLVSHRRLNVSSKIRPRPKSTRASMRHLLIWFFSFEAKLICPAERLQTSSRGNETSGQSWRNRMLLPITAAAVPRLVEIVAKDMLVTKLG